MSPLTQAVRVHRGRSSHRQRAYPGPTSWGTTGRLGCLASPPVGSQLGSDRHWSIAATHEAQSGKLALLPVGGFVSFPGEHDRSKAGSYAAQPPLIRMGIIAAGPAVNLLVAFIVFAGLQLVQGRSVLLPIVTRVIPHSAADVAGFRVDDRILTAEGTPTEYFDDLRPALQAAAGRILTFRVDRVDRQSTCPPISAV